MSDLYQFRELIPVFPTMMARSFKPSLFYVGFVDSDVVEGREAVGALVPVMILTTEKTVVKDFIVSFAYS